MRKNISLVGKKSYHYHHYTMSQKMYYMKVCLCVSVIKIINQVYNCAPIAFNLFTKNTKLSFLNACTLHLLKQTTTTTTNCVTKTVTSCVDNFICGAISYSWQLLCVLVSTPVEKKRNMNLK